MRIFLDTNVLLDVYLKRAGEPGSAAVISACGQPWNQGFIAVHTLSNAFYLIERQRTRAEAWEFIRDVLAWAGVAEITTADAARTQAMSMSDFEDALQIVAEEGCGADVIVTRNTGDFIGKTTLRVALQEDFVDQPRAAHSTVQ
jgi:predicted nucleic acid-binding protein